MSVGIRRPTPNVVTLGLFVSFWISDVYSSYAFSCCVCLCCCCVLWWLKLIKLVYLTINGFELVEGTFLVFPIPLYTLIPFLAKRVPLSTQTFRLWYEISEGLDWAGLLASCMHAGVSWRNYTPFLYPLPLHILPKLKHFATT